MPQQAEHAAAHFFRKGNLLALRELALRRTADRVDEQMQDWRRRSAVPVVWPNREALLACVDDSPEAEKLLRRCARLATQLDLPWHALHVETPPRPAGRRRSAAGWSAASSWPRTWAPRWPPCPRPSWPRPWCATPASTTSRAW
jgi:two-component system sensor histidine kinase KdpD